MSLLLSVPPNGLVIYCGTIVTDEGKEKKVNIDFEPFRPINTSLYLCDNKFHTEVSTTLLPYHNQLESMVLQWRHNERDGFSNQQPHGCLLNCLFRRQSS